MVRVFINTSIPDETWYYDGYSMVHVVHRGEYHHERESWLTLGLLEADAAQFQEVQEIFEVAQ